MTNRKVSQMYPGSNNNTITLKLVRMNVPTNGSLNGDWKVVNNNKTIARFRVEDAPTYTAMMSFYHSMAETLELTAICEMSVNLDKY